MTESIDPRRYTPAPASHAGRVVLVTGAGDGIGRAVSLALAAHRATVVLLGKTQRNLESVYDEIVAADQPRPALMPFNLETATAAEYDALHDALASEFGRLDGLAHVAGILGARSPMDHYDVPMWSRVLPVNSLNPGPVRTQMRLQASPGEDRSSLVEPTAVTAPYLFLLGPDSVGINGQAFDGQ